MAKKKIILAYDFLSETGGLERVMFSHANIISLKYDTSLLFCHVNDKKSRDCIDKLGLNEAVNVFPLVKTKNEVFSFLLSFLFLSKIKSVQASLFITYSFMTSRLAYHKKRFDGTPYFIYLNHPPNFLYSRNIKWANNLPRIFAYIGGFFLGRFLKNLDKKYVQNANLLFSNSFYTSRRVEEIYGKKSIVVFPTIPKTFKIINRHIAEKNIKKYNLPEKFILLHGRIIPDKRPDFVLNALTMVKDCSLVVSGEIEKKEKKKLMKLIKKLKLVDRVIILGKVSENELISLYNLANCFVLPAPKEDFGLVPIEAMACGTPSIGWDDNCGPKEYIINGVNGYLAKPYDIKDLSIKIQMALSKNWDRNRISRSVSRFRVGGQEKILLGKINELFRLSGD